MERIIICLKILAAGFCFYIAGYNLDSSQEIHKAEISILESVMTENLPLGKDYALLSCKRNDSFLSDTHIFEIFPDDSNQYNISNGRWRSWPESVAFMSIKPREMNKLSEDLIRPSDKWCCENPFQKQLGKSGVVEVSDIYFNEDLDSCITELYIHCGYACVIKAVRRYTKSNDRWRLDRESRVSGA